MRYLVTILFAALSFNAVGQINPNFNPDYDGDSFIGVNDVLGVLSSFGSPWGVCGGLEPSYTCWDGSLACDECGCPSAADFSPTVYMTLDNLIGGGTSSLTYTMSQDDGESEISSSSVVSDGGSFNLSELAVDAVIGSGTLSLSLFAGDYDIESDLVVASINNGNYTVLNHVTASNSPAYSIGDVAGGFVIYNTSSGVSIYTEIPVDEDFITEAYDMSLTFDDLFVNPSDGDLIFTSTLTSELGDVDVQDFVFTIESLDFSPTVNLTLDNLTESGTTSITYTMSQDNNESEIFSSSVVSDGGMFNLDGLVVGDNIGSGTLHLELYAGNYDIASNLIVSNIYNSNYTIFNEVTSSTSPAYNVGDIAGGFVISNSVSGISLYTEIPTDEDYTTEAYSMSLTFTDLFTTPSSGNLTFTSTLTSELGDVDVQEFGFEIIAAPWICGDLVSHDGYDYSTVLIGDQCWFAENCRYLPEVSPSNEGNTTDPYYYVYGYEGTDVAAAMSTSNYATYGVLYNWPAVMTE
ncbi:MAG: hypothetical protein O2837_07255, partial [Bacteroidetes bacterium]|nr:hypothetical protein [Bacteroidota bacterium]